MGNTPFGYQIENGKAVIDDTAAEQIRTLFRAYLSGDSLKTASQKAAIETSHASTGRMLRNQRYLGDEYYPAIIEPDMFAAAQVERSRRAEKLGRIRQPKKEKETSFPTAFRINKAMKQFDDPFKQAEYAYSLIKMEV